MVLLRGSTTRSKKRQGATLSVRLIWVSVKTELTVLEDYLGRVFNPNIK